MLLLQCVFTLLVFSLPFFVGFPLKRESAAEAYLYGQILLWALFQLLAVPMIFLRLPFNALFAVFTAVLIALAGRGAVVFARSGKRYRLGSPEKPYAQYLPYLFAACVILLQMALYAAGMHLDEDDSRFVVEAGDALVHNTMYLHNPATGEYIGRVVGEMAKDRFSPWAMYVAAVSRLAFLNPAVLAHTVYPPILLLLSYIIYDRIGRHLFDGCFDRGVFLLSVSIINMFFVGSGYSQAAFTLVRIWQGKATLAGVLIPFFLLQLLELEKDDCRANWLWLGTAGCAACLVSGMGVALSAIMVAGYGGYVLLRNRFRRFQYLLLALLPSVVFGLLYFAWR